MSLDINYQQESKTSNEVFMTLGSCILREDCPNERKLLQNTEMFCEIPVLGQWTNLHSSLKILLLNAFRGECNMKAVEVYSTFKRAFALICGQVVPLFCMFYAFNVI